MLNNLGMWLRKKSWVIFNEGNIYINFFLRTIFSYHNVLDNTRSIGDINQHGLRDVCHVSFQTHIMSWDETCVPVKISEDDQSKEFLKDPYLP